VWSAGSASGTSPLTLDLPGSGTATVAGSYSGESALMHIVSGALGGGRCSKSAVKGFAFSGWVGISQISHPTPPTWTYNDVGGALPPGQDQLTSGGTWNEIGGGGDIWGTADSFHLVSQGLGADGTVTAHVTSQQNTDPWAKSGPMLRATTDPGSPYYAAFVTPGNGIAVQWRSAQGVGTSQVLTSGAVPAYLTIARYTASGGTPQTFFTAYTSPDGVTWTTVPGSTVSLSLTGALLAGFAITSHSQGVGSAVTLDTVAVTPRELPPLGLSCPSGWSCSDVGSATPAGEQVFEGGTWSIQGGGGDIWGTADAFHLVSQSLAADGSITARVSSQTSTDPWAKGGLMLRATTDPGSPYYAAFVTPGNGIVVQWRGTPGSITAQGATSGSPPAFLQVTKTGIIFSAATSNDGVTWTPVPGSSMSLPGLSGPLLRGFAVSSHNPSQASTVVFDSLTTVP
jgi:hypothetical protein